MTKPVNLSNEYSFSFLLPAVIGASLLLTGCTEDGNPVSTPETVVVSSPVTQGAPEAPSTSVNTSKQVSFMAGAISSNSEYNFDITPGDSKLPNWMKNHVGTDWLLDQFTSANLNSAVLHFNYALNTATDTLSRANFNTANLVMGTPSWETIESGAIRAVEEGLTPIFYMTVNLLPESWDSMLSSKYVPSNPDAFFASYKEQLLTIAHLSEKYDSPYMSIGVELGPVATDTKYLPYWEDIISSVRQVYTGKLTYSSYVNDVNGYRTELTNLSFTNLIDMLGMNIYPQTLDHGQLDGTYEQFYAEWTRDIVPNLQSIIDKLDKPVFISEFGINRLDGTGSRSYWEQDVGMKYDYQEQSELFDAALRAIHEGLDIEGIVFWGATDSTSLVNGEINVNNSYTNNWVETPSENVIKKWADIFLPDLNITTNGGGNYPYATGGYPSTDSAAFVPVKNWYDDVFYVQGPVL